MIALAQLRKLRPLTASSITCQGFGESYDVRQLLATWRPLISSLSLRYRIPRKLDSEDIAQELSMKLVRLRDRVDPVERPIDFRKLARTELSNACIDMVRAFSAAKRSASLGSGIACRVCGAVSQRKKDGTVPCCPKCGTSGHPTDNTSHISWIDIKVADAPLGDSFDSSESPGGSYSVPSDMLADASPYADICIAMAMDIADVVTRKLSVYPDRCLFALLRNPSRGMLDHARRVAKGRNPDRWSADFLSIYLSGMYSYKPPVNAKDIKAALERIQNAIIEVGNG